MVTTRVGQRGFTLVELMVIVVILGVLAAFATPIMIRSHQFFTQNRVKLELQRDARDAMTVITRNLQQADSSTMQISRFATTQPICSRLQFVKVQGSTITYYQNGKNLVQQIGTRTRTLTKDLRYMSFAFPKSDDMTIISVSLTLERSIYQGKTKALHMASEKVQVMN